MVKTTRSWFGQNFRRSKSVHEDDDDAPGSSSMDDYSTPSSSFFLTIRQEITILIKTLLPEQLYEPEYYYDPDYHTGLTAKYLELISYLRTIVHSDFFNYFVLIVIIIAGINIGVQSYTQLATSPVFQFLNLCILVIFSLEAILKILSEGLAPHMYWLGPEWKWNTFDFTIVFLSLPFWNGLFGGGSLALLRLVRLMRLAKLIKKVPQLQMIVQGLTGGLSSIGYIMILLFLVFYLFAIAGVLFFRNNDPFHFGSLPKALITCFVCATLDSWSTIMFINSFGCVEYPDIYSTYDDLNRTTTDTLLLCDNPNAQFVASSAYFIVLVVMSALVMLSLFIGAVTLSMQDSLDELKEIATEKKKQEKIKKQLAKMFQSQKGGTRNSILQVARRMSRMSFSSMKLSSSRPMSPADGSAETGSASASGGGKYNPIRQLPQFIPQHQIIRDTESRPLSPNLEEGEEESGSSSSKPGADLVNFVFSQPSAKPLKISAKSSRSFDGDSNSKSRSSKGSGSKGSKGKMMKGKSMRAKDILTPDILRQLAEETASGESEESKELGRKLRIALGEQTPSIQDEPKTWDLFISRLHFIQTIPELVLLLAEHSKFISEHPTFVNLVTMVIILAGVNVGVQTDPRITELPDVGLVLRCFDVLILTIFTVECALKLFGEYPKSWVYFEDDWNKFDFLIVIGSYTPGVGSLLTILRLLRLLRVLKLVKSLPQLAVIVAALVMGMESIAYIALILFLCFYIFAIIGMMLFRVNDPFNFGTLHMSMFTLFRCSTLDAWADIMYINIYGCDAYPGGTYSSFPELCTTPTPQGFFAVLYFVCFVVIGAQILLTLFIGVVTTSMEEAQVKQTRERKIERQLTALKVSLDLSDLQVSMFKESFNLLDLDQGGLIELEEMQIGLAAIKDITEGSNVIEEIEKADPHNTGIDLVSFIVVLSNIPLIRQKRILRKTVKRWLANKRKRGIFFREPRKKAKVPVVTSQWIDHAWTYLFGMSGKSDHVQVAAGSGGSQEPSVHSPSPSLLRDGMVRKVSSSQFRLGSFRKSVSGSEERSPGGTRRGTLLRHASTTWLPPSVYETSNPAVISSDSNREVSGSRTRPHYHQVDSIEIMESPTFVRDFHDGDNEGSARGEAEGADNSSLSLRNGTVDM
jgi:voltage-gated sodium channel